MDGLLWIDMEYNRHIHHRRSIRLSGFDYGQSGVYFITLCTHKKECWFGEIIDSKMYLNQLGKIVAKEWLRTPKIRPETSLDEWIIMPNHLHGIIIITNNTNTSHSVGAHRRAPSSRHVPSSQHGLSFPHIPSSQPSPNPHTSSPAFRRYSKSLPSIIAGFKSATTKRINQHRQTRGIPFWQRNYYESVVRDTQHLENIRHYIYTNPRRWKDDPNYAQYGLIDDYNLPF